MSKAASMNKKQFTKEKMLFKDEIMAENLKNQNNRNTVKVIKKGTIIKEIEESLLDEEEGVNHLYAMEGNSSIHESSYDEEKDSMLSHDVVRKSKNRVSNRMKITNFFSMLQYTGLRRITIILSLSYAAVDFTSYLTIFDIDRFGYDIFLNSLFTGSIGVVSIMFIPLTRKVSLKVMVVVSSIVFIVSIVCIAIFTIPPECQMTHDNNDVCPERTYLLVSICLIKFFSI